MLARLMTSASPAVSRRPAARICSNKLAPRITVLVAPVGSTSGSHGAR